MRRSVLTILLVAAISGWISHGERAAGDPRSQTDWVRTADGWESRSVLAVQPRSALAEIHPGLVAAFQLTASLLALVAIPGRATPVKPAPARGIASTVRRTSRRALAEAR